MLYSSFIHNGSRHDIRTMLHYHNCHRVYAAFGSSDRELLRDGSVSIATYGCSIPSRWHSSGSSSYKERKGASVDKPSIELSAKALHAWISKPTSLLREVLSGLSDGGLFYTSDVSMRLLLAFTIHGGGDVHAMQAAALSRGAEDAIAPAAPSGVAALSNY